MKILHVLDHSIPLHSGYTFRTRSILKEQVYLGWETYHVTSPKHSIETKSDIEEEMIDGLYFYRTQMPKGVLSRIPVVNQWVIVRALKRRLIALVNKIKPDVLHAHSPSLNGQAAVSVGKKMGIPVVYEVRAFWEDAAVDHGTTTENSLRYGITKAMETSVLKHADAVTTICDGLRKDIISRGIAAKKITVIANAVNMDTFVKIKEKNSSLENELGLKNKTVLGFIGSYYAYEGLPLLLQAFSLIQKENKDIRIILVGGGPQEKNLKALAIELGISDKVIFTGRVPHEAVQKYYSIVDLLVYPRFSMRLTELVTPLKPIEAMAQNKLVLASDVGGHKEIIEDGKNGFLFAAGDSEHLAERIIEILKMSGSWNNIKENAFEYVEEYRTWPNSVAHYKKVYQTILSRTG